MDSDRPCTPCRADGTLLLASRRPAGSSARGKAGGSDDGSEAEEGGNARGAFAGTLSSQVGQPSQAQQGQPGQPVPQERQQQEAQQPQQRGQQWAATQALRGFASGGVKQLVVARERSMLLCLAGATRAMLSMGGSAAAPTCARQRSLLRS